MWEMIKRKRHFCGILFERSFFLKENFFNLTIFKILRVDLVPGRSSSFLIIHCCLQCHDNIFFKILSSSRNTLWQGKFYTTILFILLWYIPKVLLCDSACLMKVFYFFLFATAGVDMLQVFEAMCDFISEPNFYKWAMPSLKRIAIELRRRHPHVPLLVFTRGATYSSVALQQVSYWQQLCVNANIVVYIL